MYLDNWYSSPELYQALLQQQTQTTETVRLNRKKMPHNFSGKSLKKGEHTFLTANGIMAVERKDKKDVKMLSNKHTSEMLIILVSRRYLKRFEEVSTPGQTETGLGPRVYPFTASSCCTA